MASRARSIALFKTDAWERRDEVSEAAIERHIRKKHAGCPDFAIAYFAAEIAKKDWTGVSLGKAVGITMQTILRHSLTDYDTLLLCGVDRQEARRRVQSKINGMIAAWKKRPN